MRTLTLAILIAALAPCAIAQRPNSARSLFSPATFSGTRFTHSRFSHHGTPHSFFDALGLFSDPYYADALAQVYPGNSTSPAFMMQPPTSAGPIPEQFAPPAQPLLIELQGNTYVRLSGPEDLASETLRADAMHPKINPTRSDSTNVSPRQSVNPTLASVTLIFRDGHRAQVSDYTIANGILYTRANYYTDGSWNKKIELSSLDLPETIKLNQSQFRLPTAPNEVITRP